MWVFLCLVLHVFKMGFFACFIGRDISLLPKKGV